VFRKKLLDLFLRRGSIICMSGKENIYMKEELEERGKDFHISIKTPRRFQPSIMKWLA
jgi:hypothetical protein